MIERRQYRMGDKNPNKQLKKKKEAPKNLLQHHQ